MVVGASMRLSKLMTVSLPGPFTTILPLFVRYSMEGIYTSATAAFQFSNCPRSKKFEGTSDVKLNVGMSPKKVGPGDNKNV